jgi:hypothetical protein
VQYLPIPPEGVLTLVSTIAKSTTKTPTAHPGCRKLCSRQEKVIAPGPGAFTSVFSSGAFLLSQVLVSPSTSDRLIRFAQHDSHHEGHQWDSHIGLDGDGDGDERVGFASRQMMLRGLKHVEPLSRSRPTQRSDLVGCEQENHAYSSLAAVA